MPNFVDACQQDALKDAKIAVHNLREVTCVADADAHVGLPIIT
jgi:hypothetical protein